MFLNNIKQIKNNYFIKKLNPDTLESEISKFKELTTEMTFIIRSLFFILFGFQLQTHELFNVQTVNWSLGTALAIIITRLILLTIYKLPLKPLLFVAPRGLITILLFLSIPLNQAIPYMNKSFIIQLIILLAVFMMIGLMNYEKEPQEETQ